MSDSKDGFETWAIVELMGHQRVAGLVSERQVAGAGFLQIDVHDATDGKVLFSRLVNPSSIYAINPVDKVIALAAGEYSARPITRFDLPQLPGHSDYD